MVFNVSFIVERSDPERSVESAGHLWPDRLVLSASPDKAEALPLVADQHLGTGQRLI